MSRIEGSPGGGVVTQDEMPSTMVSILGASFLTSRMALSTGWSTVVEVSAC